MEKEHSEKKFSVLGYFRRTQKVWRAMASFYVLMLVLGVLAPALVSSASTFAVLVGLLLTFVCIGLVVITIGGY